MYDEKFQCTQFQRTLHYVPNKGTITWPITCTKGGYISVP